MRSRNRWLILGLLACGVPAALHADGTEAMVRAYARAYAAHGTHSNVHLALIPSFSRQTGLACSACHTAFPQLTPFGRLFKLNGYTMTGLQVISAGDSGERPSLRLDLIPPVSAMAEASYTDLRKAIPGTQNGNVDLPQQLSLFVGEAITPRIGTFVQVTYDPAAGTLGMDNLDVRYADHGTAFSKQFLWGVTLNNNPTVQDVWNTTPAWGFPFASSGVAPTPTAATLIDGSLSQQVAGLGVYGLWDNLLYLEVSGYRSAAQGGPRPPDGTSTMTIQGVSPYWRAALQHQWGPAYLEIGSYGMSSAIYPSGVTGPTDHFSDVAFDAQFERPLGRGNVTLHTTYITERQTLDATFGAGGSTNPKNTLHTFRVDGSVLSAKRVGATLAYFSTTGDSDPLLYPAAPVTGSATGSPNSSGIVAELNALPWLNTRFALQYVAYSKFNGSSSGYDGSGRNASDNNTLYLLTWLIF